MNQTTILTHQELLDIAQSYFTAFEKQDIQSLGNLFSDGVILFDPVIQKVEGKTAVLQANQAIFDANQTIAFLKKEIYVDAKRQTIAAALEILFNESQKLQVVDLIQVNPQGLITAVTAYFDTKQIA